jgi:hypothetical protein
MKINAFIVGAQKSGSTAIFQYLKSHPNVLGHELPEISFFHTQEFELGETYLWEKYYHRKDNPSNKVILAKHVMEFSMSHGLERIKAHNDKVKIIVCLRDPLERVLSAYKYARNEGWEKKSLNYALENENNRLKKSWNKNKSLGYVHNSLYGTHLNNLFSVFPKDQVLVINHKDLKDDTRSTMIRILRYLNLEIILPEEFTERNVTTEAKSIKVAQLIRSIISSDGPAKKIVKKVIPSYKLLILRNWLLSLNRTKKIATKPVLDSSTEAMLSTKFAADFEQLPTEYQEWFSKYSRR